MISLDGIDSTFYCLFAIKHRGSWLSHEEKGSEFSWSASSLWRHRVGSVFMVNSYSSVNIHFFLFWEAFPDASRQKSSFCYLSHLWHTLSIVNSIAILLSSSLFLVLFHFPFQFFSLIKRKTCEAKLSFLGFCVSAAVWGCDVWRCGSNLVTIRVNHEDITQHAENDQVER